MVINDIHLPFSNSRLISADASGLVLDVLEDRDLDRLIINGDLMDFYNVNSHGPKHPDIQTTLEDEMNAGRDFFRALRKRFPDLEIVYLLGNHGDRLDRFIIKNSKVFWNMLTIKNYFELDELGIEFHPYPYKYQLEDTICDIMHSPPSYGENGARTSLLKKMDRILIYGCSHREQKSCSTGGSGVVYSSYFNGWLGSTTETPEHERVFSYAKKHDNWQECFIIANVVDRTQVHITQYSIRDHSVCVDGYLFEG